MTRLAGPSARLLTWRRARVVRSQPGAVSTTRPDGESLLNIESGSRYGAVLQALMVIAGEDPIDAAAVPPVRERPENLDRDWCEQPAFAGEPLAATRPGDAAATTPSPRDLPTPR
jgi:hypothetical protein